MSEDGKMAFKGLEEAYDSHVDKSEEEIWEQMKTTSKKELTEKLNAHLAYEGAVTSLESTDNNVNHPLHYNQTKYEAWDVLDVWFSTEPLLWNVGKYLNRAPHKGKMLEDLKKARAYLNRRIDQLEKSEK